MSKDLQVIRKQEVLGKEFRVYGTVEEPLFLAKDVAEWIDYSFKDNRKINRDVSKMLGTVDEDEKVKSTIKLDGEDYSHGGIRENVDMWFLTEDGLYEVLMQSRKPIAKAFKKEVKKILKDLRLGNIEIHKLDSYMIEDRVERAKRWIEEEEQRLLLLEVNKEMKPKADSYDRFMDTNNSYTATQLAKLFGISSARRLNTILNDNKIIYKQGSNWLPYANTNEEWFRIIVGNSKNNNCGYQQLRFTALGIMEIARMLGIDIDISELLEA